MSRLDSVSNFAGVDLSKRWLVWGCEQWEDVLAGFDTKEEALADLADTVEKEKCRPGERWAKHDDGEGYDLETLYEGKWVYAYVSYWIAENPEVNA